MGEALRRPTSVSTVASAIASPSCNCVGEIAQRDLCFEMMGPSQRLYSNFIRGSLPVRIVD